MTSRQLLKYRAEWGRAWKALRAAGRYPGETADEVRQRWHLYIGAVVLRGPHAGQPKSSTTLTNRELDAFLKRCAATHSPSSLKLQLALDEQPLVRLRHAADHLLDLLGVAEDRREGYLAGIYDNVQRRRVREGHALLRLDQMPDADLQLVLAALTHTVWHRVGAGHDHGPRAKPRLRPASPAPTQPAASAPEPFEAEEYFG